MSEKSGDQSALLFTVMGACIVLKGVIITLWYKWEKARKDVKQAAIDRENMLKEYAIKIDSLRERHALEIKELNRDMNRTSEKLSEIMSRLNASP